MNAILRTLTVTPNPSPEPPPPGGTAVGTLPDGQRPGVGPTDADRTLSWSYEGNESISVPKGWTGWINLGSTRPSRSTCSRSAPGTCRRRILCTDHGPGPVAARWPRVASVHPSGSKAAGS